VRGAEPFGCVKGSGFPDEATPATPLWAGSAALYYLQLFPSRTSVGNGTSAASVSEDSGWSSRALRFRADRVRGDAGAYSPANQRAECGDTEHGDAGVEAARFASAAPTEKAHAVGTEMAMGGRSRAEVPTVLAATVLRFQCVERKEKERKDELHALQSGEARAGDTSEGLVMEQLWFLFPSRNEFVRAESGVGGESERLKTIQDHVKIRTFSAKGAEKVRHPREFQSCSSEFRCRAEGQPPADC
jgi:hypothetical protein